MALEETARKAIEPLVEERGLELYDVEHASGILRVTVDRAGGIDVDAVGEVSHAISELLDDHDLIAESRYLLEVSSPGIERRLRTPSHFSAQVGNTARLKLRSPLDGSKRYEGIIQSADQTGIELQDADVLRRIEYSQIDSARTVFDWSEDGPAKSSNKKATAR
jgi:ribosome maturation factor RimP